MQTAPPTTIERIPPQAYSSLQAAVSAGHLTFDRLYLPRPRVWVAFILVTYLALGSLYALRTPDWQAPDEPAHYNNIAHIAQTGTLPVLKMGDYNQELLDFLLYTHFAPKVPTLPLRYEAYQPPLYYVLATPIYWLTQGNLLALRFFNLLLGALGLWLLYAGVATVFPNKTLISGGALAFAALLPMQIAVAAAVNNDVLAQVMVVGAMYVLLRWMRTQFHGTAALDSRQSTMSLILLGFLLGLGMVTKIYAYLVLPVAVATVVLVAWLRPRVGRPLRGLEWSKLRRSLAPALWVAAPALTLALPLWVRNISLYGRWDIMGLRWHDAVVSGQPTTAEWIARFGLPDYMERALSYTFQSFWGVFGWMGVFMDSRVYTALLVFTGVLFLGVLWAVVRMISGPPDTDMDLFQTSVLMLFGLLLLGVTASYLWYNLKFVQHQGRYFFWGMLPISVVVALGWREVLYPFQGLITGLLAGVLALAIAMAGVINHTMDKWTVLTVGLTSLFLLLQPILLSGYNPYIMARLTPQMRRRLQHGPVDVGLDIMRTLAWALPFVLLALVNLSVVLRLIPQQLGR
ncbi:MAG: glycosyltransferase family 39 protein [Caldilineaceae bacterium]|nr:glycosyltransferase family 39 protein [Caldilineaceae bacterium]